VCFGGKCVTPQVRDNQLTKQSGVAIPTEKPAVGGDRVRVRTTSGVGTIFAQCAANERLTGGGCKGGDDCMSDSKCRFIRSYPGGAAADDTLGGRWYCSGPYGTVSAFALCQEARAIGASGSGSGAGDGSGNLGSGSGSGSGLRTP
jgi:hypothetical protein